MREEIAPASGGIGSLDKDKQREDIMLFLEYPKCSTCRKAKAWLDAHQIDYIERHIAEENPSAAELVAWHRASGLPLKKFYNTSGMLYKELNLKDRLLASNGMLVKRPLLIDGEKILVGFKETEWEAALDV